METAEPYLGKQTYFVTKGAEKKTVADVFKKNASPSDSEDTPLNPESNNNNSMLQRQGSILEHRVANTASQDEAQLLAVTLHNALRQVRRAKIPDLRDESAAGRFCDAGRRQNHGQKLGQISLDQISESSLRRHSRLVHSQSLHDHWLLPHILCCLNLILLLQTLAGLRAHRHQSNHHLRASLSPASRPSACLSHPLHKPRQENYVQEDFSLRQVQP